MVSSAGECVWLTYGLSRFVVEGKVKAEEVEGPWACLWFSCLAVIKYSRFLWSVQILQGYSALSTKCRHSCRVWKIANISLS